MKSYRKISYKILLGLAVLLSLGLHTYSNCSIQNNGFDTAACMNGCGDCFNTDIDSVDDDQINPANESVSFFKHREQISAPFCSVIINQYSFAIWQPPKKS
jgi:hypothetical protein